MRPEDILGHVKNAKAISVIIGAGASRAANIPIAGKLVEQINARFEYCLQHLSDAQRKDYGQVMGALSPADRKAFIEPLLADARISWGQIALALLVKGCNIRRILTFNFDLVLERAASLTGQHLPVYDFGVAPSANIAGLAEPALFHLHGQSYGLRLLNTAEETAAHKKSIGPLIADSMRNHVVIVSGYSGENDAAFEIMQEEYNDQNYLFWLGHEKEPKAHLKPLLGNNYASYLGDCDFDDTMIKLAKGVGVWPPQFVTNPPFHLLEELEDVADFPVSKNHPHDLLGPLRARLQEARSGWEDGQSLEGRINQSVILGRAPEPPAEGEVLTEAEKKALATSFYSEAASTWTPLMGMHTTALADANSKALSLYEKALHHNPNDLFILSDFGAALIESSKRAAAERKIELLDTAHGVLSKALEINEDDPHVLANLGLVILEQARMETGDARKKGFAEAEKYLFKVPTSLKLNFYNRACLRALQGRSDEALNELEKALEEESAVKATHVRTDPDLESIREHPRFLTVLEALEAQ